MRASCASATDGCNLRRAAWLAVALTLPCRTTQAQEATVHSIWVGSGQQDNGTSWTIEITYHTDESVEIAYPSLGCGGRLELIGPKPGGGFRDHENLTYDPDGICMRDGLVVLHNIAPNELSLLYHPPDAR